MDPQDLVGVCIIIMMKPAKNKRMRTNIIHSNAVNPSNKETNNNIKGTKKNNTLEVIGKTLTNRFSDVCNEKIETLKKRLEVIDDIQFDEVFKGADKQLNNVSNMKETISSGC